MYIEKLVIRNFRNFNSASFVFKPGVNTIIGENAAGKTNAFLALRFLVDDTLNLRSKKLKPEDFNRALTNWKGHWVCIESHFSNLGHEEIAEVLANHAVGTMTAERKGNYTYIYRPKKAIRMKLFELSEDNKKNREKLDGILKEITIEDYEVIFRVRSGVSFESNDTYKKLVGDFENIVFPNPDEEDTSEIGANPTQMLTLTDLISCTYIKALRDVISTMRFSRSNPLVNLLRDKEKNITVEEAQTIINSVAELNRNIGNLPEIKSLASGITKTIDDTIGSTYAPSLEIKSELPENMEELLKALTIWVGDNSEDHRGTLEQLSLGGANLIFLSLKLHEYEIAKDLNKVAHFLLIEEPEAHIHTHIQKSLFRNIELKQTQVFLSTHSTHISESSRISSMNVLSLKKSYCEVYQPARGLSDPDILGIERYLDAIRSNLLFAKGVILVEGDAELILIPKLIESSFGVSLDEIGVSIISMNSATFSHIAKLFHKDRINKNCSIITDLDLSLIELPALPADDDEEQKKARASQKSGLERKAILDQACMGNEYVKVFYSQYTLESDFFLAGNRDVFISMLPKLYSQAQARTNSKQKLEDQDPKVGANEAIRLAKKEGKGWFALALSEQANARTNIPENVLQAVAFAAKSSMSKVILESICRKSLINLDATISNEIKTMALQELKGKMQNAFANSNIKKFVDFLGDIQ